MICARAAATPRTALSISVLFNLCLRRKTDGQQWHARTLISRLRCPPSAPQKNTIRSANGERIEEYVMVHRTDIAGGSSGQASPGNDRMRRPALSRVPPRKTFHRPKTYTRFSLRRHEVLWFHDGCAADPRHLSRTPDPMRH
jgi:hypothetical protein